MPLIFIHGVNTRDSDPDYHISMAQRRRQFDDLVVAKQRKEYPKFAQCDDIYWGDLGVRFRWGLDSVPRTHLLQSLGPEELGAYNPALIQLVEDTAGAQPPSVTPPAGVQVLGSAAESRVFLNAVKNPAPGHRPGDVIRSIFAPEAARSDPSQPAPQVDHGIPISDLEQRGRELALLFQAAEEVARNVDADPSILTALPNDEVLLDQVYARVADAYQARFNAQAPLPKAAEGDVQNLGNAVQWVGARLGMLVQGAKSVAVKIGNTPARAATLLAMQGFRGQVSGKGLRFFGDVFVYLYQGYNGAIAQRVCEGILAASKISMDNEEPLVVVTHSFGSIVFYDALTSGKLPDISVTLWVSAGAQTSLFAEMALYHASEQYPPKEPSPPLGKPTQVTKWINFYDAADILSYLHEPVFGPAPLVTDIPVREGANATMAHGHYFLAPSFYERVATEIPDHL